MPRNYAALLVVIAAALPACLVTPASPPPSGPPPSSAVGGARVTMESVDGADAARAGAAFAPAARALSACQPGTGGVVHIRLQRRDGRLTYSIEPGTELDTTGRRCVLSALQQVQVDDNAVRGSPSDRPSGFTALFRIDW